MQGQRVRVAARRRLTVKPRDRSRAGRVGEEALRQQRDRRKHGKRQHAERRREHDRTGAQQHHHRTGRDAVAEDVQHRARGMTEPERDVHGRTQRPVEQQLDQPDDEQPPERRRRRRIDRDGVQDQRAGERIPAVGDEVGQVAGAKQPLAAGERADDDRGERDDQGGQRACERRCDQRQRRQRLEADPGRQPDLGVNRDHTEHDEHRQRQRIVPSRRRRQQHVTRQQRHEQRGVDAQPCPAAQGPTAAPIAR